MKDSAMDKKDKTTEERKENKPLSFSISMILKDDGKHGKQQEDPHHVSATSKRVPMATIHHFAPVTDSHYLQFGKKRFVEFHQCRKRFYPNRFTSKFIK